MACAVCFGLLGTFGSISAFVLLFAGFALLLPGFARVDNLLTLLV